MQCAPHFRQRIQTQQSAIRDGACAIEPVFRPEAYPTVGQLQHKSLKTNDLQFEIPEGYRLGGCVI
jgi:hypothetical protein